MGKYYIFLIVLVFVVNPASGQIDDDVMYAHYINVGQGDCTLLEFSCGAILIGGLLTTCGSRRCLFPAFVVSIKKFRWPRGRRDTINHSPESQPVVYRPGFGEQAGKRFRADSQSGLLQALTSVFSGTIDTC